MPPQLVGINHVALEVADLERSLAFYGRLFELRFRGRSPSAAFVDIGDQFLALMQGDPQQPDGARHVGLVVDDKEAVRRDARRGRRPSPARAPARLPRPRRQPHRDRPVRPDPVHEERRRCCAGCSWSSARPTRRSRSCARRASPDSGSGGSWSPAARPMRRGCNSLAHRRSAPCARSSAHARSVRCSSRSSTSTPMPSSATRRSRAVRRLAARAAARPVRRGASPTASPPSSTSLCRTQAFHAAVAAGLLAPLTLFVNVEPEVLDGAPFDELAPSRCPRRGRCASSSRSPSARSPPAGRAAAHGRAHPRARLGDRARRRRRRPELARVHGAAAPRGRQARPAV